MLQQFYHLAEPIGGEITVISESEVVENVPKTAMEKVLAEQLKSSKFSKPVEKSPSKGCYYTSIPRVIKQKGASGPELTSMNLDKVFVSNLHYFCKMTVFLFFPFAFEKNFSFFLQCRHKYWRLF